LIRSLNKATQGAWPCCRYQRIRNWFSYVTAHTATFSHSQLTEISDRVKETRYGLLYWPIERTTLVSFPFIHPSQVSLSSVLYICTPATLVLSADDAIRPVAHLSLHGS